MKTPLIVQSLGICLFLMWSFTVALPVIDAGGPPVRFTLGQSQIRIDNQRETQSPPPTQLLPTQWESPTQLIPTEFEFETVITTSEDPAIQETGISRTGRLGTSNTNRAEIDSLLSFLDSHLSTKPLPLRMAEYSDRPALNLTPWIVGESHENSLFELHMSLSYQLYFMSLASPHGNGPDIDDIWLPASQWWRMAGTAIPKSAF